MSSFSVFGKTLRGDSGLGRINRSDADSKFRDEFVKLIKDIETYRHDSRFNQRSGRYITDFCNPR